MSVYIYVVTLNLDTPVYLTDCHRNYDYNGHNFIAGKLKIDQSVVQRSTPSANDFSIQISAVDNIILPAIVGSDYKGRQCLVERLELNSNESVKSTEVWLDGDLNKYNYINNLKDSILKLSVSSIFGAFESVKSVDLGVQFADTINVDQTLYWGKSAPKVTINGGAGGGTGGTVARPKDLQL